MAYDPTNNPYLPGDPYSYDLKWMVREIKGWKDPADSADRAKASEEAAKLSEQQSEAWAVGTIDGEAVPADAPQHDNNSKHWSDEAAGSAAAAKDSEDAAKDYADHIADPVSGLVTDWLDVHITQPTTPAIDKSLLVGGAAADAEVTGYRIDNIEIEDYAKQTVYKSLRSTAIEHTGEYFNVSTTALVANSAYTCFEYTEPDNNIQDLRGKTIRVKGYSASNARLFFMYQPGIGATKLPATTAPGTYEEIITIPNDATQIVVNGSATDLSTIEDNDVFSYTFEGGAFNILKGKHLCSAGDSLTAGAQAAIDPDTGEHETYAYITARRNNMVFTNAGSSGDLIGDTTIDGVLKRGFSNHRYQEVPADLDYLTIYYGWNDEAYGPMQYKDAWCYTNYGAYYNSCTAAQQAACDAADDWTSIYIGTLNDATTNTWCGAWNIVLDYYRRTYTSLRVGVILPFVSEAAYRTTLIDLCKKYGVAYIDSYDPNQWFITSRGDGLSASMQTYLASVYTADSLHPNTLGHLMESNKYEAFIRSL